MGRLADALAIAALAVVGIVAAGLVLVLVIRFLPLIAALVLALVVALAVVWALVAVFSFFASAAGAVYYAFRKPPTEEPGPAGLDRAREMDKRSGRFSGPGGGGSDSGPGPERPERPEEEQRGGKVEVKV